MEEGEETPNPYENREEHEYCQEEEQEEEHYEEQQADEESDYYIDDQSARKSNRNHVTPIKPIGITP